MKLKQKLTRRSDESCDIFPELFPPLLFVPAYILRPVESYKHTHAVSAAEMPSIKKRSKSSHSPFGQGGVSHAIKRPSKAKLSAEKAKRDKSAKAAAAKLIRERRRMSAATVASAPATPAALRTLQQQTARAGSLTASVDYVLKNGQYQFSRRRSPRKHADMYRYYTEHVVITRGVHLRVVQCRGPRI